MVAGGNDLRGFDMGEGRREECDDFCVLDV